MKYIYIKNNLPQIYIEFDEPILEELNGNNLGTTYEDFLNGMWVLLNNEQVAFHSEYPNATVLEVFNLEISAPKIVTLQDKKLKKIEEIEEYDLSTSVNSFMITTDNKTIEGWFTANERSNYRASIDAAKLLELDNISFYVGTTAITIPTLLAERFLALIQLYADQCFMVTKLHILEIEQMNTIEEIDTFDITVGYPNKLEFTI